MTAKSDVQHEEVFAALQALLQSEEFAVTAEVLPQTRFADLENWDSFRHLRFLLAVEEQFAFELSPEQGEALETLGDLVELAAAN